MHALIVYESTFGNTRDIALAIADGLAPAVPTDVIAVADAPPAPDVDLLIVGAPTLLFGLSGPRTRAAAARRAGYPAVSIDVGVREWLDALPRSALRRDALTFETRLRVRALPGSAAKDAAKQLRKRGYRILWPSQSYHVANPNGQLADREIERAQLWGRWISVGIEVKQSRL